MEWKSHTLCHDPFNVKRSHSGYNVGVFSSKSFAGMAIYLFSGRYLQPLIINTLKTEHNGPYFAQQIQLQLRE